MPVWLVLAAGVGLMVGSFLNVVIYRLPVMLKKQWRRECRAFLALPEDSGDVAPFNLAWPASHCPKCQAPVRPWQNIPLLSFILLKGRCHHCQAGIGLRYPLVEALTGLLSVAVVGYFGLTTAALAGLILTWGLVALSGIDIDHQLLPDNLTLPLLWLGLLLNDFNVFTDLESAVMGAMAGYLVLWSVYQLFKLLTGKEGMGYGDFKLLAVLGAWLGWQYLPMIILLSSLLGAVVGVTLIALKRQDKSVPIPFGPYLAGAGWLAMIWGEDWNAAYLQLML
ncbi:MAG: A24 family peptidase [Methylococcales bacterium]|nr:A24 family peptidase [Methylococcales bacterium]